MRNDLRPPLVGKIVLRTLRAAPVRSLVSVVWDLDSTDKGLVCTMTMSAQEQTYEIGDIDDEEFERYAEAERLWIRRKAERAIGGRGGIPFDEFCALFKRPAEQDYVAGLKSCAAHIDDLDKRCRRIRDHCRRVEWTATISALLLFVIASDLFFDNGAVAELQVWAGRLGIIGPCFALPVLLLIRLDAGREANRLSGRSFALEADYFRPRGIRYDSGVALDTVPSVSLAVP